jgi:hypothetical protein
VLVSFASRRVISRRAPMATENLARKCLGAIALFDFVRPRPRSRTNATSVPTPIEITPRMKKPNGQSSTLGNPPSFHAAPIKLSVASAAPELPSHRLLMACEKIFSASSARESTNACARSRSCSSKSRTLSSRALSSPLISGLGFIEPSGMATRSPRTYIGL